MRVPKACVLLMVGLLMGALLGRSAGAAEQKLRLEVYADFDYNTNAPNNLAGPTPNWSPGRAVRSSPRA